MTQAHMNPANWPEINNDPPQQYDVEIDGELRHIDMVGARKSNSPPPSPIDTRRLPRSPFLLCIDCVFVTTLIVMAFALLYSMPLFMGLAALAASLLLTVYGKLVWWVLCAMGPPDHPHVIAIIKAPEKLFCPRCGDDKTDDYCANCGVDVTKAYQKAIRKLAQYVVDATEEPRRSLEASLQGHIDAIAAEQRELVERKLAVMERHYVMEIVRQRKLVADLQRMLPAAEEADHRDRHRQGART